MPKKKVPFIDLLIEMLPDNISIRGISDTNEIYIDGEVLEPFTSQKVRNHSPDGFAWGYAGSGPSQLALAILLEYLPITIASSFYMRFKEYTVAQWPANGDFEADVLFKSIIKQIKKEYDENNG